MSGDVCNDASNQHRHLQYARESGQFISLSLLTKFKQDANPIQIVFDIQLMRITSLETDMHCG